VPLSASTRAATLTWFVDGALVGSAAADQRVYWTPAPGRHEIVVADDAGRKARRTLVVEGHGGVQVRPVSQSTWASRTPDGATAIVPNTIGR
jgi:hypothetical protein